MKTAAYVEILDREGVLLAAAAEAAGSGAEGHTGPRPADALTDLDGTPLLTWFREGHGRLVDTLAGAAPDVRCWHFLPAPSPLAFWARRQAHETAVHRIDAESARGGEPTGVGVDFAVDGVDELLCAFHAREKSGTAGRSRR
ncbi:uncharacterized protein (TIGR03083 family) [Streptomyces sp. SAI-129]